MLKYTYKKEFNMDSLLTAKIRDSRDLAQCFWNIRNAIFEVYDVYISLQNPNSPEYQDLLKQKPDLTDFLNNYKYKDVILSNFKKDINRRSDSYVPKCFSEIDTNLKIISEITGLTGAEQQIMLFACLKSIDYLRQTRDVFVDQIGVLGSQYSSHCDIYYVCLYEDNILVVSIFVFLFKLYKQQAHFFIVKELDYSLKKFMEGQPELKNSSILLHSFAAYIFNSDQFFTHPLPSMVEIFQRNNIKPAVAASQAEADYWQGIIWNTIGCYPSFIITHIYSTADIKFKWLEGIPFEDIKKDILDNQYIFFVPKNLKGGNIYKILAYKYKIKYLKLNNKLKYI